MKLAILDFGQVKELSKESRFSFCRLVLALKSRNPSTIANAMREAGFKTKSDKDDTLVYFAEVTMTCLTFFDTVKIAFDSLPKENITEDWMKHLEEGWEKFPADYAMLFRVGVISRGLCSLFHITDLSLAEIWAPYAERALKSA
jgi:predicted unusual protein kinase regulating ubiquinone biosynthesis (AarF/ABC1/UbiB family)